MQNFFELIAYRDMNQRAPFREWHESLNRVAYKKVATALDRMTAGNLSNVKPVGEGVLEYRINFGPGYRIYFGRDGERLIILLAGGDKSRQQRDIETAKARWQDHKNRR